MPFRSALTTLAEPDLSGNEARYLQECIATNQVSSVGPFVSRFENAVAAASELPHAVATSSGTAALHVALVALGVTSGDLVVVPSYTFIASANAVHLCGATPWLFDVEARFLTLDVDLLREEFRRHVAMRSGHAVHTPTGRRVAAILPVHALGIPADLDAIAELAARYRLPVVADGAAALGATVGGRAVTKAATLTALSFNGNKTITSGGGGAVVGADPALIGLVRSLSTTARAGDAYEHERAAFNYRMTNVEAAIGCAQIERLEHFLAAKRDVATAYHVAAEGRAETALLGDPPWGASAHWMNAVMVEPERQERVLDRLSASGIGARRFWRPLHWQPPYRDAPRTTMEHSEDAWRRVVALPSSTSLTDSERAFLAEHLRSALGP
ncbi:MAG: aminotransferase class I/II-fold pyridoxal phosphate-dependent enzyme [Alphaproteobacteria bacterium]|nr:aminotransferase class I/II-fold pyridoxal phosphate-dependent enzyme [Alphaproteobacteria bacterium]